MKERKSWIIIVFVVFVLSILFLGAVPNASACPGRVFNPVTDVDWTGIFPIKIGGVTVASFGQEGTLWYSPGRSSSPYHIDVLGEIEKGQITPRAYRASEETPKWPGPRCCIPRPGD